MKKGKILLKFSRCLISGTMAFLMFFVSIGNVFASTLDIDSVSNKFPTTTIIDYLNQWGGNVKSNVNTVDSTLDIYSEEEKIMSFKYTSEYIEYDNRDAVVTKENVEENFNDMVWISGIIESILSLSGYENRTIFTPEDENFTNTYDTYGIQMETEHYEFKDSSDNGNWTISGDYLKYFKISLDTDKIKNLMETYGVSLEEQDPNENILKDLKLQLEAKDITDNSVTIYPSISNFSTNDESPLNYTVYCYIYRSTSKDGAYEKISDTAVNCLNSVGLVDENLDSNTTYYYKGKIVDYNLNDIGADFSEPIEVTTKNIVIETNNETTNTEIRDKDGNVIKNPETGVSFPLVGTLATGVVAIIILRYLKRKNVFYKI